MEAEYKRRWPSSNAQIDENGLSRFLGTIIIINYLGSRPQVFYRDAVGRQMGVNVMNEAQFWRWFHIVNVGLMGLEPASAAAGKWD